MARTSVVLPVPSSPLMPTTAGAWSVRANAAPHASSSASSTSTPATARPGATRPVARRRRLLRVCSSARLPTGLQIENLVADLRRQLEVQLVGRAPHLGLELLEQRLALGRARVLPRGPGLRDDRQRLGAGHRVLARVGQAGRGPGLVP